MKNKETVIKIETEPGVCYLQTKHLPTGHVELEDNGVFYNTKSGISNSGKRLMDALRKTLNKTKYIDQIDITHGK